MKKLAMAAIAALMAGGAWAADLKIKAGGDNLFGAKFGQPVDAVLPVLTQTLGSPTQDSGRIPGCPLNGVDERFVDWGGFGAQFFADESGTLKFERWTYRLGPEGNAVPDGPQPNQIVMPGGIKMGDPFTMAAKAWGFEAKIDDVFGIAWYFGEELAIMTAEENINAPIVEIGVPHIGACE